MKIQLDTVNKTITIEEDVNLHDFYEQLNSILPDGKWREFTLKVSKITEWRDPINVPRIPTPPYNPGVDPWTPTYPQIWYTTNTGEAELNPGVYNFKM